MARCQDKNTTLTGIVLFRILYIERWVLMNSKISSDLLRGHADTMILKLLLKYDKYGYEIGKLIYMHSDEQYELKEATLYSSLKRLEKEKCIQSYWGEGIQGGRRKYYMITQSGKEKYKINIKNWQNALKVLEKLL